MSSHLDFWRPSKRQLETLADCVAARLDTARTARLLGVSEPVFVSWTKRLAAAVAEEERREAEFLARPVEAPALTTAELRVARAAVSVTALRPI
jgi:hypothetical protein